METKLSRRDQEILRRVDVRLADLESGIARHEGRLGQLREIRDRVKTEREEWLASRTAAAEEKAALPVEETVAEEKESPPHTERQPKPMPPPEAESVRGSATEGSSVEPAGASPEELWSRFWTSGEGGRPKVVYPWSPPAEGGV